MINYDMVHKQSNNFASRVCKMIICRCEEVTEEEIRQAVRNGAVSMSGVKRRTRACMGLCQGHTCSKLIARIISEETGKPLSDIQPSIARPPVRPVTVKAFLNK